MKLKYFQKKMEKMVFTAGEAHLVAFKENPQIINLQLHQWCRHGDIIRLKRGLYMFADSKPNIAEIAKSLYAPCYFSFEYALSMYGIIPEAVFTYTLATVKATRRFKTPLGVFLFQTIKKEAFTGFNQQTLLADKEKTLVDYFYLNSPRLIPENNFWESSRLEANETNVNFKKAFRFAALFRSKKLNLLLASFQNYAKSHKANR